MCCGAIRIAAGVGSKTAFFGAHVLRTRIGWTDNVSPPDIDEMSDRSTDQLWKKKIPSGLAFADRTLRIDTTCGEKGVGALIRQRQQTRSRGKYNGAVCMSC